MSKQIAPAPPRGVHVVAERATHLVVPIFTHSHWSAFDWLTHGITGRDADMSLFGGARSSDVLSRWRALRDALHASVIVHARQLHRADIQLHADLPPGILIAPDADGHATSQPNVLLAVSVADCIPVYLVAPDVRAVAMLHAGWRGVASAIVERGIEVLRSVFHADVAQMRVHFGPAICGNCYQVGAEVATQLSIDGAPTHVDLRAAAAARAISRGVSAEHVSISTHCTRCGDAPFFSHRGGCAERQIAVLGVRA